MLFAVVTHMARTSGCAAADVGGSEVGPTNGRRLPFARLAQPRPDPSVPGRQQGRGRRLRQGAAIRPVGCRLVEQPWPGQAAAGRQAGRGRRLPQGAGAAAGLAQRPIGARQGQRPLTVETSRPGGRKGTCKRIGLDYALRRTYATDAAGRSFGTECLCRPPTYASFREEVDHVGLSLLQDPSSMVGLGRHAARRADHGLALVSDAGQ